jgi:hypothetical protein
VQQAIDSINQTYEIEQTNEAYNYRSHELLAQLSDQVDKFACSGGVWTQTTDVEGEVNGLLTYDRRVLRPDAEQWRADIQALYDAATLPSREKWERTGFEGWSGVARGMLEGLIVMIAVR